MAAKDFTLSVVAPDRAVLDGEPVKSVMVPGAKGYLGIWPHHVGFLTALRPGIVEYYDANNQRHYISVTGGFAEVSDNRLTILADSAERASDIDVAKAEEALEQARRAMRGESSEMDSHQALEEMERAMARLKVAQK